MRHRNDIEKTMTLETKAYIKGIADCAASVILLRELEAQSAVGAEADGAQPSKGFVKDAIHPYTFSDLQKAGVSPRSLEIIYRYLK